MKLIFNSIKMQIVYSVQFEFNLECHEVEAQKLHVASKRRLRCQTPLTDNANIQKDRGEKLTAQDYFKPTFTSISILTCLVFQHLMKKTVIYLKMS